MDGGSYDGRRGRGMEKRNGRDFLENSNSKFEIRNKFQIPNSNSKECFGENRFLGFMAMGSRALKF
jgi:hypothetical protein